MAWEHKVVRIGEMLDEKAMAEETALLDSYGRAGWELVQIVVQSGHGMTANNILAAIFKRPLADDV
jgi:hypothetical protein